MLWWPKPLTLMRGSASPWLPWTPANLCCPCVGSELRRWREDLGPRGPKLTVTPSPQGWCVGVGCALEGRWWQSREGWDKTALSSFDSRDQDARTDGLSVTSPMPGRSWRQQVTGSGTGKPGPGQGGETLCDLLLQEEPLQRLSSPFSSSVSGAGGGKGAVSNTLTFHSF